MKPEPVLRPRQAQDVDDLLEPLTAALLLHPEHAVFVLGPSQAEPQREATVRDVVHHRGVLGEPQRVVERRQHDGGPQLQPFRASGDGGDHR